MPIRDPVRLSSHYTPRREAWAGGEALRDIILKMVNALGSEGVTQAKEVDVEGGRGVQERPRGVRRVRARKKTEKGFFFKRLRKRKENQRVLYPRD